MIGTRILHYRIESKLGEGGMGEVFLAEDTTLDRKVALKFLPPHFTADPEFRSRFEHEAKAAAALNHPNIVTVYELSEYEGRLFIAMEYVAGKSLETLIKDGKTSVDEAIRVALQICAGLGEAHQAGIIHRDIKPSNILLDTRDCAKLLDFGLAKSRRATTETKVGTTLGTLQYESPEQTLGKPVDPRSDLFSLGAVFYEMITGRVPFHGEMEQAVRYSIVHESPEPLARYKSCVPEELQRIVSKLLEKDPELRYQTAGDLAADLRAVCRSIAEASPLSPPGGKKRPMLVVLPFQNLGPAEEEYFADGMTEEITSRLAAIRGLGVISRTSALHYRDTRKTVREIGSELCVDYILEGTVRWSRKSEGESRVRITPQLIQVSDDTHLWSERYDRVIDDIFTIQSDIAGEVIEQLNVTLLEPERQALEARPTENMEAYEAYLHAVAYTERPGYGREDFELAIRMLERAVQLDPDFALAFAELSSTHTGLYFHGWDRTDERLRQARTAIDRALALAPESPEVHAALGIYHYRSSLAYESALKELQIASAGLPNNSELELYVGAIKRRQGKFSEAMPHVLRAFELDPRNAAKAFEAGVSYFFGRRYSEALQYAERSIALEPDQDIAYMGKAWCLRGGFGDLEGSRAAFEAIPAKHLPDVYWDRFVQELYERDYDALLTRLAGIHDDLWISQTYVVSKPWCEGTAYSMQGSQELAVKRFEAAREMIERELEKRPEDARLHSSLGVIYASLERKSEAIREAEAGVALCPVEADAMVGTIRIWDLAMSLAQVGETDAAIDKLEYLMSIPAWFSVWDLKLNPLFDPLRDHPRFQALLKKGHKVF
jgi:non-specific serine/threonine protein kinase